MNVNFNGFNENAATFLAANTITAVGQPVKPSAEGAVTKCASGDAFCGIVTGLRGGYAEFPASARISVGYQKLAVNAAGQVAANANGREYLVVNATEDTVGIIL